MDKKYVDKNGELINESFFYDVYPYTTPHIFAGFVNDDEKAIFKNFQGACDYLSADDVSKRVSKYQPEEIEKLLDYWRYVDDVKVGQMADSFIGFLTRHLNRKQTII